jgi:DNA-binding transcriptional regulator of glucitol operon
MFWFAIVGFAVVYGTNTVLALMQSKTYTTTFTTLRRRGRVAIGKKKGLLTTGAIVMFLVDEAGTVVDGTRLTGVTVLARFRPFGWFNGQPLATVDAGQERTLTRSVQLAVGNARDNYVLSLAGATVPEPPGPLTQWADSVRRRMGRPPKGAAAIVAPAPKQRITLPQPR